MDKIIEYLKNNNLRFIINNSCFNNTLFSVSIFPDDEFKVVCDEDLSLELISSKYFQLFISLTPKESYSITFLDWKWSLGDRGYRKFSTENETIKFFNEIDLRKLKSFDFTTLPLKTGLITKILNSGSYEILEITSKSAKAKKEIPRSKLVDKIESATRGLVEVIPKGNDPNINLGQIAESLRKQFKEKFAKNMKDLGIDFVEYYTRILDNERAENYDIYFLVPYISEKTGQQRPILIQLWSGYSKEDYGVLRVGFSIENRKWDKSLLSDMRSRGIKLIKENEVWILKKE